MHALVQELRFAAAEQVKWSCSEWVELEKWMPVREPHGAKSFSFSISVTWQRILNIQTHLSPPSSVVISPEKRTAIARKRAQPRSRRPHRSSPCLHPTAAHQYPHCSRKVTHLGGGG